MSEDRRRVDYLIDTITVPQVEFIIFTPEQWAAQRTIFPVDRFTGWTSLHHDGTGKLRGALCPGLLVRASGRLPWSLDAESTELVLNEDTMDVGDADHEHFVCHLDEATANDETCPCGLVHGDLPPRIDFEACDSPTPDPYEFFDNYVRLIARLLNTEASEFLLTFDPDVAPADPIAGIVHRRQTALDELLALHPALHRFVLQMQAEALDLATTAS